MRARVVWGAAGVLLCLYGLVVRMAGSGTSFYLIWFFMGGLCFLHLFARKLDLWNRVPGWLRRFSCAVFALIVVLFLAVEGVILSGFSQKGVPDLDYIIVLGAQVYASGPSVVLQYRLDRAAEYLSENPDTLCIVSGGQGGNEPYSEAEGMYDYLTAQRIAPERLIKEDASQNTAQNIAFSTARLAERGIDLKEMRVGIVTNDFHVYRGVAIARKHGLRQVYGIAAGSHPTYLPNNLLREFFGVLKDKVMGNA